MEVTNEYYQKRKERIQKNHEKDIKIFLKNKKTKKIGEKRSKKVIKF